jgi:transcriptional regulator with XRE-family HTH domain
VTRGPSPTLRRRELGALLRKLRTDKGLSAEEVTARLLFSPTKLSRIETGHSGASARDIRDLSDYYGVTDPGERERLMTLAREGKQRAWWQDYDLPYATYAGLENEATSIRAYDSAIVPGLLQTEDYARSMYQSAVPRLDGAVIEQRVEARLKRQNLLAQDDLPHLHYILDEAVLQRHVGSSTTMRTQLERITKIGSSPNVTVQVIPWRTGAHAAMGSNFTIMTFQQALVDDIVYVEGLIGNVYLERPEDIARYTEVFSYLSSFALDLDNSLEFIRNVAASYKA